MAGGLAFAFWVVAVLGNGAFVAADVAIRRIYGAQPYESLYLLAAIVYFIVSFQRVWTSARSYSGPAIWAGLARLIMLCAAVLAGIGLLLSLYVF
ncbi:MAG: hypothetical protein HQL42_20925 [Alphaproteobacteria bacterium]|nr:hypothetical protein [Alphaproteobacteria bacterium]